MAVRALDAAVLVGAAIGNRSEQHQFFVLGDSLAKQFPGSNRSEVSHQKDVNLHVTIALRALSVDAMRTGGWQRTMGGRTIPDTLLKATPFRRIATQDSASAKSLSSVITPLFALAGSSSCSHHCCGP